MRRWLLNLATVISLALFVATGVIWLSTMSKDVFSSHFMRLGSLLVRSAGGQTELGWTAPGTSAAVSFLFPIPSPTLAELCTRHAFGIGVGMDPFGNYAVVIPHWFIAIVSLLLPARWLVRRHRAKRAIRMDRCATCGYDLRATPDRCPECGTAGRVAV
jgi:hypothetical protein